MSDSPIPTPSRRTSVTWLRLAALVCVAESVALVALAVVEIVGLNLSQLVIGITTTIFFAVYAAALVLAARGLSRAQGWTRAPLMLSQLIQLGLAWSFHGPGTEWVAALLAVPALVVVIILVLPSTTAALFGSDGVDGGTSSA